MKKILIVDFTIYQESLSKLYKNRGYDVDKVESAYEAMQKMNAVDYDLVVSEVELPGDNAFDLYRWIQQHFPYIPVILTTEKEMDSFINDIFMNGAGNVLSKPIHPDELMSLSDKLMHNEGIFGLGNYLDSIKELKRIRITASGQIAKSVKELIEIARRWGYEVENPIALELVLNEMVINAVYHSHGLTKEKESRTPVTLPEGHYVDIFAGHTGEDYGYAITDYNGTLTKKRILESINSVVLQERLMEKALETGADISELISETGRGIDLVRKITADYYFIIRPGHRTEIILVFSNNSHRDDIDQFPSLKIIEDYS